MYLQQTAAAVGTRTYGYHNFTPSFRLPSPVVSRHRAPPLPIKVLLLNTSVAIEAPLPAPIGQPPNASVANQDPSSKFKFPAAFNTGQGAFHEYEEVIGVPSGHRLQ
jgi:hypothetical protein